LELSEKHDSTFHNSSVLETSMRRRLWKISSFLAGHAPKLLEFAISPKVPKTPGADHAREVPAAAKPSAQRTYGPRWAKVDLELPMSG
jgi:hypothetical protein